VNGEAGLCTRRGFTMGRGRCHLGRGGGGRWSECLLMTWALGSSKMNSGSMLLFALRD